jgi:arylsulfatase A
VIRFAPLSLVAAFTAGISANIHAEGSFARQSSRPLNVIVFLIDDMGATDLGCMGSRFYQTPNVDRLAQQGLKFTTAYSACTVCSPSRAALLTGKYPARLHITDWIPGEGRTNEKLLSPDWRMYLPNEERTLGNVFHDAGYATASIGKWHLGGPKYYPEKHGFDINIAGTDKGQPPSYFSPYHIPTLKDGPVGEFLTDRESQEAVRFIEANKTRPFFLYLPHHAVHTPLMGKPGVVAKYRQRVRSDDKQNNPTYAALVESVDDSVGNVMQALERNALTDNTVVIFTSDNGGLLGSTYNIGMRAGKGSAYQGGVRVPLIVRWPGITRAGAECAAPVITMDLYSTLLHACGASVKPGQITDGADLLPLLQGSSIPDRPLFWHYPHYHGGGATPYSAVRDGDYRLIQFYEDNRAELYNLKTDPLESTNIAKTEPKVARKLLSELNLWRKRVKAQAPVENANYGNVARNRQAVQDLD